MMVTLLVLIIISTVYFYKVHGPSVNEIEALKRLMHKNSHTPISSQLQWFVQHKSRLLLLRSRQEKVASFYQGFEKLTHMNNVHFILNQISWDNGIQLMGITHQLNDIDKELAILDKLKLFGLCRVQSIKRNSTTEFMVSFMCSVGKIK